MILSHCNESDVAGCIINVIIARIHSFVSYGKLALSERHATHDTEIFHKIFHRAARGGGLPAAMIQTDFDRMGIIGHFELGNFISMNETAEIAFFYRIFTVVPHGHAAFFFNLVQRVGSHFSQFSNSFFGVFDMN